MATSLKVRFHQSETRVEVQQKRILVSKESYGDREPTSKHDAYLEFCALLQSTDGQKHHKDHKHNKHLDTLTPKTTYSMVSKQCLAKLQMSTKGWPLLILTSIGWAKTEVPNHPTGVGALQLAKASNARIPSVKFSKKR